MEYRSIDDLARSIIAGAHTLPPEVDVIVGIPRSGMLAASILALHLNLPLLDLDSFLSGATPAVGRTVKHTMSWNGGGSFRKAVVLDDSVATGESISSARDKIRAADIPTDVLVGAVYASSQNPAGIDFHFEVVPQPRIFQWNFTRNKWIASACFDIDGVLCHDPSRHQNDDGTEYVKFLLEAKPFLRPQIKIAHLVTSRLEKYRAQTEDWLDRNGIAYEHLWMLDLPTAEERRALGMHAKFKARIYKETGAHLFVESEHDQAIEIAELSQKPVLSIAMQEMVWPSSSGRARRQAARKTDRMVVSQGSRARAILVPLIGKKRFEWLRGLIK